MQWILQRSSIQRELELVLALGHCPQLPAMMPLGVKVGRGSFCIRDPGPGSENTSPQVGLISVNTVYRPQARINKACPGPLISQHACAPSCCASPVSHTTKTKMTPPTSACYVCYPNENDLRLFWSRSNGGSY